MTNKDSDDKPQPFSSNRFQVEVVRDLILRLMELVSVGQPDLRYAATVAIWQLSSACVERTCQLYEKEQIITRQSKAIQKNSQMRKLQSLQENLTQWKRHKAELEEIVLGSVFQGVFIHRYRDTNPKIRISSMEWLSTLTVKRPDLFLENKFLKYFGWLASDKEPQVRLAAVQALLEPFLEAKKQTTKTLIPIQIQDLQSVCFKFLPRIVDCIEDSQSLHVQELAMSLLLNLEKNEFLDEWDDDNGWDQINLKALDMKTSPKVRKDALYFVLDQMDSFDTVGSENEDANDARSSISYHGAGEKKIVERLESISSWYV
jgi:cohesin complex subunit SA-1/2